MKEKDKRNLEDKTDACTLQHIFRCFLKMSNKR